MEYLTEHLSEILSFIAGILTGWSIKFVIDKSSHNKVTQKNIFAGGDVVGRDKSSK
jgi:hypothetical protein